MHLLSVLATLVLLAGCSTAGAPSEPATALDVGPVPNSSAPAAGLMLTETIEPYEISFEGARLRIVLNRSGSLLDTTLPAGDGRVFSAWAPRPGPAETLDIALVASDGIRHTLQHVRVDPDAHRLVTHPMDLDELASDVDGSPPAISWTPDGTSVVWIEAIHDAAVLRTASFGRFGPTPSSSVATQGMTLGATADLRVDGFRIDSHTRWTLLLRHGMGDDVIEVPMARRADGSLALPDGS